MVGGGGGASRGTNDWVVAKAFKQHKLSHHIIVFGP